MTVPVAVDMAARDDVDGDATVDAAEARIRSRRERPVLLLGKGEAAEVEGEVEAVEVEIRSRREIPLGLLVKGVTAAAAAAVDTAAGAGVTEKVGTGRWSGVEILECAWLRSISRYAEAEPPETNDEVVADVES